MQPVFVVLDSQLKAPQVALIKGVRLARGMRAPLVVFVNAYSAALVRAAGDESSPLIQARKAVNHGWQARIEALLDECGAQDLDVDIRIEWVKDDDEALRDAVLDTRPALVVVHAGDDSHPLKRLLLTPRHWQLLRKAPCSVLCVNDAPWVGDVPVLAAVDPDHDEGRLEGLNAAIVRAAREMSDVLDSSLDLAHVIEHPDEALILIAGEAIPSYVDTSGNLRDYYQNRLSALAEQAGLGAERHVLLEGSPAAALAEYQSMHMPLLLVLGTVHRGPLRRLLLGSTAEKIAQQASGDLLVVKDEHFSSPWQD
ncbi:Universal stress protein family [Isoalcanivorax pacificus W11-5]|uniref:Universal stress protein family n=1 Tax=Isoalcanivorax pacificus W11-5 TaxID=391936 RepID=A0A0B4XIY0_9GAMM|nr:universal stress protein [Isoalcanivorax pacificus]AJD48259.1 Universal stress protein family [Isoalcanivorax pacificus W11-5]